MFFDIFLESAIKYKIEEAGGFFIEVPAQKIKPSQTCPKCLAQKKKELSERIHQCEKCGYKADRDVVSAIVCLNWALGTSVLDVEQEALAKLTDISSNNQQKKLWQLIMTVIFSGSVLSCAIDFQAEATWSKDLGKNTPAVARILNQATSPLLIGSPSVTGLLSLSYSVGSKVQLLVEPECRIDCVKYKPEEKTYLSQISEGFSDVFLFKGGSYEKWLHLLEKEPIYQLKPIVSKSQEILLWRVEKRQ